MGPWVQVRCALEIQWTMEHEIWMKWKYTAYNTATFRPYKWHFKLKITLKWVFKVLFGHVDSLIQRHNKHKPTQELKKSVHKAVRQHVLQRVFCFDTNEKSKILWNFGYSIWCALSTKAIKNHSDNTTRHGSRSSKEHCFITHHSSSLSLLRWMLIEAALHFVKFCFVSKKI